MSDREFERYVHAVRIANVKTRERFGTDDPTKPDSLDFWADVYDQEMSNELEAV